MLALLQQHCQNHSMYVNVRCHPASKTRGGPTQAFSSSPSCCIEFLAQLLALPLPHTCNYISSKGRRLSDSISMGSSPAFADLGRFATGKEEEAVTSPGESAQSAAQESQVPAHHSLQGQEAVVDRPCWCRPPLQPTQFCMIQSTHSTTREGCQTC